MAVWLQGVYNFSDYDSLAATMEVHGVVPYWILDYGNPLYDGGLSPCSDEGRAAFAAFTIAMMDRFKGRGIVWELWNGSLSFFKPSARQFVCSSNFGLELGHLPLLLIPPGFTYFFCGIRKLPRCVPYHTSNQAADPTPAIDLFTSSAIWPFRAQWWVLEAESRPTGILPTCRGCRQG